MRSAAQPIILITMTDQQHPHDPYDSFPQGMGDMIEATQIPDPLAVEGELERPPHILKRLHENTLVIYTSDHGDLLGDHQQYIVRHEDGQARGGGLTQVNWGG
jgi:hypothetical protein